MELTRYLQFQLSIVHEKIEKVQDEISLLKMADCWGTKLTNLQDYLKHWQGKREALQEIWDFKIKKGL